MMKTKPVSLEQFMEGQFPVFGLDLAGILGEQRSLTTRTGTNVRTYDLAMRARGGSRAGLSKLIDEQVSGFHRIDHLNMIVDPTPRALTPLDDPGEDWILDPSTNNLSDRVEEGVKVRPGGSGWRIKFAKLVLVITANSSTKPDANLLTFSGTEFTTSGLEILDSVSTVNLVSAGAAANAPEGTYPIVASQAQGRAVFYRTLADKYIIQYVQGVLTVPPPGAWVVQSIVAEWDVAAWNVLDEQTLKSGKTPEPPVDDARFRSAVSAAHILGPFGPGVGWSANATFRDFIYNFFNVSFAPNATTNDSAVGPSDGFVGIPTIGATYEGTIILTLAGTFGDYTYDCGTVTWTVTWIFQAV